MPCRKLKASGSMEKSVLGERDSSAVLDVSRSARSKSVIYSGIFWGLQQI